MKKILSIFLLPAFCVAFSTNALAYDFFAVNNGVTIYYNITSSSSTAVYVTYANTNYNSYSGSVDIPIKLLIMESLILLLPLIRMLLGIAQD